MRKSAKRNSRKGNRPWIGKALVNKIKKKLPEAVLGTSRFRGETTLQIRPEDILPVCRFLRDDPDCAFDYLVDLCGVDHLPREPRFEVVYHLRSMKTKDLLRLKGFPSRFLAADLLGLFGMESGGLDGAGSFRPVRDHL